MYELIQVGENSFYMDCPAKAGIYRTGEKEAVVFDTGSDKDAGKKLKKLLDAQGWSLKAIYNTHFHADHTGGNQYLQKLTGCRAFAPGSDLACTVFPVLEPTMLYGGRPMKELQNKFLMAGESSAEPLTQQTLPEGIELIPLPGHTADMVGFRTPDDVVFLADSLASAETLEKYKIAFLHDPRAYIDTLERIRQMEAACFVPSHAAPTDNIAPLAELNIKCTLEVMETVRNLLSEPKSFEALLADVFGIYSLTMNLQQRMLVGSTLKSFLSCLKDEGEIEYVFEYNMMLWKGAQS